MDLQHHQQEDEAGGGGGSAIYNFDPHQTHQFRHLCEAQRSGADSFHVVFPKTPIIMHCHQAADAEGMDAASGGSGDQFRRAGGEQDAEMERALVLQADDIEADVTASVSGNGGKRKKKPYKELTLEEKVELIRLAERCSNLSQASIAERYAIAKSNVCRILQRKAEYVRALESAGFAGSRKRKLRALPSVEGGSGSGRSEKKATEAEVNAEEEVLQREEEERERDRGALRTHVCSSGDAHPPPTAQQGTEAVLQLCRCCNWSFRDANALHAHLKEQRRRRTRAAADESAAPTSPIATIKAESAVGEVAPPPPPSSPMMVIEQPIALDHHQRAMMLIGQPPLGQLDQHQLQHNQQQQQHQRMMLMAMWSSILLGQQQQQHCGAARCAPPPRDCDDADGDGDGAVAADENTLISGSQEAAAVTPRGMELSFGHHHHQQQQLLASAAAAASTQQMVPPPPPPPPALPLLQQQQAANSVIVQGGAGTGSAAAAAGPPPLSATASLPLGASASASVSASSSASSSSADSDSELSGSHHHHHHHSQTATNSSSSPTADGSGCGSGDLGTTAQRDCMQCTLVQARLGVAQARCAYLEATNISFQNELLRLNAKCVLAEQCMRRLELELRQWRERNDALRFRLLECRERTLAVLAAGGGAHALTAAATSAADLGKFVGDVLNITLI